MSHTPGALRRRQRAETLAFLADQAASGARSPTLARIGQQLGVSTATAFRLVCDLEERGRVRCRGHTRNRTIEVLAPEHRA